MDIIRFVSVGVVGAISFFYLKSVGSELSILVSTATGLLLLLFSVDYVIKSLGFFVMLYEKTGINGELFTILVKVIIISYLADFTEALCKDVGASSIGEKVSLVSRLIIFVVSIPVFENLFTIISALII
ncbi:MAG: hypothetical protein IKL82_04005 [Clostridia bacterium]|nr:hypothetical protein [Clostridia bacterium]